MIMNSKSFLSPKLFDPIYEIRFGLMEISTVIYCMLLSLNKIMDSLIVYLHANKIKLGTKTLLYIFLNSIA